MEGENYTENHMQLLVIISKWKEEGGDNKEDTLLHSIKKLLNVLKELLLYVTALQQFLQILEDKENQYMTQINKGAQFNDESVERHRCVKYAMEM
jgi:hypothetical protein